MCYRTRTWGLILIALGIGFILSCLFSSWFIRLLIGIVLVIAGLLVGNQR